MTFAAGFALGLYVGVSATAVTVFILFYLCHKPKEPQQ